MDSSTKRWTFTLSKFDEPFGVQFYFKKNFTNRCQLVRRSYSWLDNTMGKYLHSHIELGTLKVNTNMCTMDKLTKRWTFTSPKIDKPFSARFHFENFWEPLSIGVKVILLAGHDNTLYIPYRVWNS
jgi:hypothetical protein